MQYAHCADRPSQAKMQPTLLCNALSLNWNACQSTAQQEASQEKLYFLDAPSPGSLCSASQCLTHMNWSETTRLLNSPLFWPPPSNSSVSSVQCGATPLLCLGFSSLHLFLFDFPHLHLLYFALWCALLALSNDFGKFGDWVKVQQNALYCANCSAVNAVQFTSV